MISVEEFLAAHPVPAAPQEVVTGRDKGRGGGKHTAVRDDVAVRDNADAREDAVAYDDAIGCRGADVREDDADCGDIAVHDDTAAPRSSARFGGTFGASRDDDVVRYARSGRRAGARKADRRDERRRSAGGFAVTVSFRAVAVPMPGRRLSASAQSVSSMARCLEILGKGLVQLLAGCQPPVDEAHRLHRGAQHRPFVGQAEDVLHEYVLDALLAQPQARHEAVAAA